MLNRNRLFVLFLVLVLLAESTGIFSFSFAADLNQYEQANDTGFVAAADSSLPIPSSGLDLWLKFDETSGTTASDSSGNDRNGTLMNGAEWSADGKNGGSVNLDGTDDWVNIPDLSYSGDFTIGVWIKLSGTINNADSIVGQEGNGQDINFYDSRCRLYNAGPDVVVANTAISPDTWTHYVISRSGSAVTLYINGVQDATGTWTGTFNPKAVGRGEAGYLGGSMDDLVIYNRALSQQEVDQLVESVTPPVQDTEIPYGGLDTWLKFDETSGTTASDSSGSSRDGALINGAAWSADGKYGGSVSLDGTDDYVNIPDMSYTGDFTLGAWVRLTGTINNADSIVGQEGSGQDINFYDSRCRLYSGGSDVITANTSITADKWTHFVITRSESTVKLYVNNVQDATGTWTGAFTPKVIGRGEAGYLGGRIDDLVIYNRALSEDEISHLYYHSTVPLPPGLNVLTLSANDSGNSIYYNNIQASFPSVNWQTLDRLYISAGTYQYILIQNLPDRSPDRPLIITNKDGQVLVTGSPNYSMVLNGGSNWILTGKYDAQLETGDQSYQCHQNGNYANSQGKYGIEISHADGSGLAVGGGATNFELSYIESSFVGFAGILIKTDNTPLATMDGVKIHDMYVHDTASEGMYIGSTGDVAQQHKFTNLEVYNNRIVRTGAEGLQLGQLGDGVDIHNNVVFLCAIDWKNPWGEYQDGCLQISQRDGNSRIHDNIFIGAAEQLINLYFLKNSYDNVVPGNGVKIDHNYFSSSRRLLAYIGTSSSGNNTSELRFEDNTINDVVYEYGTPTDNIPVSIPNHNAMIYADNNLYNTLYISNNNKENNLALLDSIGADNGDTTYRHASGNTAVSSVSPLIFMDKTFPDGFDYKKIEIWGAYSALYDVPLYYEYGDYVMMRYNETGNGQLFKCIQQGTNTDQNPLTSPNVWQQVTNMTDDLRLDPSSPYQGIGLLY